MLKLIMKIVTALSCVVMMSCSAKVSPQNFAAHLESRFVDNSDGTLTDKLNLLQWTKDDSTPGPGKCYAGAEVDLLYSEFYIECLNKCNYLGHNDWRMPTYKELESLFVTSEIKNNSIFSCQAYERLKEHKYWSTADFAIFIYDHHVMLYNLNRPIYSYHLASSYYVWPVRSNNKVQLVVSSEGS